MALRASYGAYAIDSVDLIKLARGRKTDELESLVQFKDQMRHFPNGAAPADVHKMLYRHRLIARRGP